MKFSNTIFNLFFLFVIFFISSAKAEYCDLLGCDGDKIWIYIPISQYERNNASELSIGSEKYVIDRSDRLFKEDKLPDIGEIVTLNKNVLSFRSFPEPTTIDEEQKERWLKIQDTEKEPYIYNKDEKVVYINDTAYKGANNTGARRGHWDLNKGMTLKILNYQHINGILFAWAEVVKS